MVGPAMGLWVVREGREERGREGEERGGGGGGGREGEGRESRCHEWSGNLME